MWNHENNWGMDGGWGWGTFIVLLLGTIAFLLLVAYLVRTLAQGRGGSNRPSSSPTAMQVLDERLARGRDQRRGVRAHQEGPGHRPVAVGRARNDPCRERISDNRHGLCRSSHSETVNAVT
jgi:hypothetical protein